MNNITVVNTIIVIAFNKTPVPIYNTVNDDNTNAQLGHIKNVININVGKNIIAPAGINSNIEQKFSVSFFLPVLHNVLLLKHKQWNNPNVRNIIICTIMLIPNDNIDIDRSNHE